MAVVKVSTIGNSTGIILPKEILNRLHVKKGDTLYLVETQNGVEITPYDPTFAEQVTLAEEIMRDNRDVLKKLAE